jgi:hypothetical protein
VPEPRYQRHEKIKRNKQRYVVQLKKETPNSAARKETNELFIKVKRVSLDLIP